MIQEILIAALVLGGMGILFGVGLSYAAKVFAVEVDERVPLVREALPGANCGACGFPGCDGFAAAVVDGRAQPNGCPVGGDPAAEQVSKIMGIQVVCLERHAARVMCNGKCSVSREKYKYQGIEDCFAASQVFGGHKACSYGCLGHGNCMKACPFGAIDIAGGIARIIEDRCKACEKCVAACPKKLIGMVPASKKYSVICKSKDRGPVTKKNCDVGCIGCMKCIKTCPEGAISMDGFLAKIDPDKCTNCDECLKVCPTMAIRKMDWD